MSNIMTAIFGINWKTTSAGVTALLALCGKIVVDVKAKNFTDVFTDAQFILGYLSAILIGVGLIKAKDSNVTGAGTSAVNVNAPQ